MAHCHSSSYAIAAGGHRAGGADHIVRHYVVSVRRSAWTVKDNTRARAAPTVRSAKLTHIAAQALVQAVHFLFPRPGHT